MFGDIAIMVFALIAIFTKKRWAIITATIWFIVGLIIGMSIGFIEPNLIDTNLSLYNESTDDILTGEDKAGIVLISFEILFIIIGWIRVVFSKKTTHK